MLTLKIEQDTDAQNPRTDFDNCGKMVCFHGRYNLGDEHDIDFNDFSGWDAMRAHLIKDCDAAVILPLYLFDHSGITMATSPFGCRWDSGQVGFIYMDKDTLLKEAPGNPKILTPKAKAWATKYLQSDVHVYDQYLTVEVYGFVIEDEEGETVDSCWGFYGEDYCRNEGQSVLESLQRKAA